VSSDRSRRSSDEYPALLNPPGMPRPLRDGRPVPWAEYALDDRDDDRFVAWEDDHHVYRVPVPLQDPERLYEAFHERLCVVCGERLGDPVHFFADMWETGAGGPDNASRHVALIAQGGLHRRCARLTQAHCPGVPAWDLLSVPAAMWDDLVAEIRSPDGRGAIRPDPDWLDRAYELSERQGG